jgi:hypothetical protein
MEPKIYHLYLPLFFRVMILFIIALLTAIGFVLVWFTTTSTGENIPPPLIAVAWLGIMILPWYWVLTIPYKIQVQEHTEIAFKSLLRTRRISAADIVSIKPDPTQLGFLIVKLRRGKLRLINQFDAFHEFIGDIKSSHPSIELHGC